MIKYKFKKSTSMTLILLLLTNMLFFSSFLVSGANNSKMGVSPSSTNIEVGDDFYLTVWADGDDDEPVYGWKIENLYFNETLLGICNATEVNIVDYGYWTQMPNIGSINNDTGLVWNIWATDANPPKSTTNNVTCARINFTSLTCGVCHFKISGSSTALWKSGGQGYANVTKYNATVTIHPQQPISLTATTHNYTQINLTFSPGTGGSTTVVRASNSSSPTTPQSGTAIYNGTATQYNHSGLTQGQTWYYSAWTYNTTHHLFSLIYQTASASTTDDTTPPTISTVQDDPDPQETGGHVNITATVDDNVAVNTVTVNITDPGGGTTNTTMPGSGTYYYNTTYTALGTYAYFIWANDTAGNSNTSSSATFTIQDSTDPEFVDHTASTATTNDSFVFNATVTDNVEVDTVWVEYWYGTGSHTNTSMTNTAGNYWTKTITIAGTLDTLHYNISANDTSNNWNQTTTQDVTITDNDDPTIIRDNSPDTGTTGDTFTFNVSANDNVAVASVNVTWDHGTLNGNKQLTETGNYWLGSITLDHNTSALTYIIQVNDTSARYVRSTEQTVPVSDNDKPTYTWVSHPTTGATGEDVLINLTVTDNIGVTGYNITVDGTLYTMTKTNNNYTYAITIPSDSTADIVYSCNFTDAAGNYNNTGDTTIDVTDNDDPTSSVNAISSYWKTASCSITATASDNIAVNNVTLYYRYSSDNTSWGGWVAFGTDTVSPWQWTFTFTNASGHYEFYTIATDTSDNTEDAPGSADAPCGYDPTPPSSFVINITTYWKNASHAPLSITASASDAMSGVNNVTLYYRYSNDNDSWGSWTSNGTDSSAPWSWNVAFANGDGYYEFYSIATDNASNAETAPATNDTLCGYDTNAPTASLTALSTYTKNNFTVEWSGSDATSGLATYTVQVKENVSGTWTDWLENVSYTTTSSVWQIANTTENCTVYFKVLAVDNASTCGSWSSTANTTKDTVAPYSHVDAMSTYEQKDTPLLINATAYDNTSGLQNVSLYYYNSTDNSTWSGPWRFGVDTDPWILCQWSFTFPNSTGYYRFYSRATDNLSTVESAPITNDTMCYYNNSPPNTPHSPSPTNATTGVSRTTDLSWTGGDPDGDEVTYDVYFGTTISPSKRGTGNQSGTTQDVGTLSYSTTYYWKIVSWDEHGESTIGPLWSFTTESEPSTPSPGPSPGPSPAPQPEEENELPVADAGGPYSGYVNETITFDGSGSYDPNGTLENYTWDFGDGTTGYGSTPTHVYAAAGLYNVTLTVTDNASATNTTTTTVTISERPEGFLFDVLLELTPDAVTQGTNVSALITLINVGEPGQVNGTVAYKLYYEDELIWEDEEAVSVLGQLAYTRMIETTTLQAGTYTYAVTYTYGDDQTATAQGSFTVTEEEEQPPVTKPFDWTPLLIALIIIICIIVFIAFLFKFGYLYIEDVEQ